MQSSWIQRKNITGSRAGLRANIARQLAKALASGPDLWMSGDEFLLKLLLTFRLFLIKHFLYPIPKYMRKVSDYRRVSSVLTALSARSDGGTANAF